MRRADEWSTDERPRWVLGSVGPGTKLPTLGHVTFAELRDAYEEQVRGMLAGGIDAVVIETAQDLLQAKAAIIGSRRALEADGSDLPRIVHVTVETTGTMLLGTEIGAALTALEPLGIDVLGLNCATGPTEMSEHLRHLARHSTMSLGCMPNAGLPQLTADGAHYPLTPEQLADALDAFTRDYGLSLVGGCCGTTPEHIRQVVERVRGREVHQREPVDEAGVSSLYQHVPFRQDTTYLTIGERTNANGSKAFREAMLEENWDDCVEIARAQTRDGAHLLDLCIDYVGRDGVADMSQAAMRLASASTLPIVLDSTEPPVIQAGLERLAGRCLINSVNYEDGDGPESRFARMMALVREHGTGVVALCIDEEGQARTADWKVRVATRLIEDLTGKHGMKVEDIVVDCLTFPVTTGQEETRRDALETIEAIRQLKRAYPAVQTTLGVSNVSFGVNPAARSVLNSVFLHECVEAGLDSAIVHAARIMPLSRIPEEQLEVAMDLVYDRRREGYDPLQRLLEVFADVTQADTKAERAAELAALPLAERLQRRIVDGERNGLSDDLDSALGEGRRALEIVNQDLLSGMKEVGELFGSRPDAAAVRAAVRRGDEGRRGPPRAAHGGHRRAGQGHDRARHRQGRRPRHRQEPRRHHPHQQRLHGGQPRHQAAGQRDPRRGAGARRRRDRHVRAAGQEHGGDAGEPRGAQLPRPRGPLAGDPRRRGAHPWLRRGGPGRAVQGRGALRARRVRGAAADGRAGRVQARRAGRRAARAAHPARTQQQHAQGRAGRRAGPLRRGHRQPGARAAVLGLPGGQGPPAARRGQVARRTRDLHGPVGPARRPRRRRTVVRGAGGDRGPARGCGCGSTGCRPSRSWNRRSSTATGPAGPRATA